MLTQGVPGTSCGRDQAGKVPVDVLLSSVRNRKEKAVSDRVLKLSYRVILGTQV